MKSKRKMLPVACCVAILSACTSTPQVSEAPWVIRPNINTSNTSVNPDAMYKLGRYYQGQQRDKLAIEFYQKAIAADHRYVEAYNGLGVIYAKQGQYQQAIDAFKTALHDAPSAAHLYSNMGYAYYLQGRYAEAVAALKQATTLDPSNHKALNNLGMAYAKAGSKGESFQAFAQASTVASANPASIASSSSPSASIDMSEQKSASVTLVFADRLSKPQAGIQALALPKNIGIIRPAPASNSVPVIDSRVKLVQLTPNVYELHTHPSYTQPIDDTPVQIVEAPDDLGLPALRIEVSNGNGVAGMASKVGGYLVAQGYQTTRLTNQKPFNIKRSQIQYRDGHYTEAQILQGRLPESPELIQRSDMRADIGVRLVLGKDMKTHLAYFGRQQQKTQLASMVDEPKS